MKTVMLVFGTRPEAIKMCPLVQELKARENVNTVVCVTGQHRQMLDSVLADFAVVPDYDLAVMKNGQSLFDVNIAVLQGLKPVLEKVQPDLVLVHGDTTTTYAAALACYYMQIPVGHVEAGLRTGNIYSPYPEEFNRQAVSIISKYNFAPTEFAKQNLLAEGRAEESIFVTGNTVIDALKTTVKGDFSHEILDWAQGSRLVVLTAHRRENLGQPIKRMFSAILHAVEEHPDVKVVYPVHLNPEVQKAAQIFENCERVRLAEPMDVVTFHNIIARSFLVLTDSGGIQEEAPGLAKPVLVMRDTTERPEGVAAGTLRLVGTGEESVYRNFTELLDSKEVYEKMARSVNPYGDGYASKRIADIITK